MSINKVVISGNLTRDAELRSTPSGTSVLNLGVAVNDRRRNSQTGEWEDYANFIDCTMFGRRAESLAQYLTKGTKVAIEGRLHYSSWQDRNTGANRSKVDVTVDEIEFMSSRYGNGGGGSQGGYQPQNNGSQSYGGGQAYGSGGGYQPQGNGAGQAYSPNNGQAYGGQAYGGGSTQPQPQPQPQSTGAQTYGAGGYDAQRSQNIPEEAPTPSPYTDEDIPF